MCPNWAVEEKIENIKGKGKISRGGGNGREKHAIKVKITKLKVYKITPDLTTVSCSKTVNSLKVI